jgi:hypothetical protein
MRFGFQAIGKESLSPNVFIESICTGCYLQLLLHFPAQSSIGQILLQHLLADARARGGINTEISCNLLVAQTGERSRYKPSGDQTGMVEMLSGR